MAVSDFDLKGFLNDPQVQANKPAAIQYLQSKGIIDAQGNVINQMGQPQLPQEIPVPGAETALFPASKGESFSQGMGDAGRIVGNTFADAFNLFKNATYGTAKNLIDIPIEATKLVKESPSIGSAVTNFAKALPEETIKTLWGFIPQSAKELANTSAIAEIPKEFQQLAKESGGYAKAFINVAKSLPEGTIQGLDQYVTQIDRARQAVVNHPLYEALGYLGLKQLVENPKAFAQQTKQGFQSTGEFVTHPIESLSGAAQNAGELLQNKVIRPLSNTFVNQERTNWMKPTETPKAGYNKPTEIYQNSLAKGNDIASTLINDGVRYSDNIQSGNYNTADTADMIRADNAKISKEILRPSLKMADPAIPRTPVDEVISTAINNIKNNKFITPEVQSTLLNNLEKSRTALEGKYPTGLSLTDLLDEKIVRDLNSKYNPLGDIGTTNEVLKNKAIADATRTLLETKAPPELSVPDFMKELQKQYQAADYLDALHGKKAPVSITSRIAKTTAKVVGAAVGHHLGGGVLGGVGGYHIGGMMETMFENLPNPIKGRFLDNLERTNPAAFEQFKNYLGVQQTAQLQRKLLSPAPEIGTVERPIITPEFKGRESKIQILSAEKTFGRNPKTGQYKKVFKSTPHE